MNYKNYLKSFRLALYNEIQVLRKKGGQKNYLSDGLYLDKRTNQYIYSFTAESEILFPDDTPIDLNCNQKTYTGTLLSSEGFFLIVALKQKVKGQITRAILLTSPWFLLEELKTRLEELKLNKKANMKIAEQLLSKETEVTNNYHSNLNFINKVFNKIETRLGILIDCNQSQRNAIERGLNQKINFIWGPPGTGKTSTLGLAVAALVESGESVLIIAHSNTAVDTAMNSVAKYLKGYSLYEGGFVLRYGLSTTNSLDDFPKLKTRTILREQNPKLVEKIENFEKQKRDLIKHSRKQILTERERQQVDKELASLKQKLKLLKDIFRQKESELIKKAEVVGCTFSKATIAKEVYQRQNSFDAVVIDEASMAYIPHCFFVATLAKRRILIFGDFRQLGPISQGNTEATKEWLERDIFEKAGITNKVNRGKSDSRLTLLDTQYRMYPAISEIPNRLFYKELLKDSDIVTKKNLSIVEKEPAAGEALVLYDISQLSAFCFKEIQSHSRFNLISALIAINLARQSIESNHSTIGIITPYNAQARLIRSLLKDLSIDKQVKVATVHSFQGSEQNVIIFDSVDGKPQANPGLLIKGGMQSSAARLANVAISRAQGKFIGLVNYKYIIEKLDSFNIFRKFIDRVKVRAYSKSLKWQVDDTESEVLSYLPNIFKFPNAEEALNYIEPDLEKAREQVAIYWSNESIKDFFPLDRLKDCSAKGIQFFLSGIGNNELAKELTNTYVWNSHLNTNIGLIGIDKKVLWIYLNTVTASSFVIKIDSPQAIKLLHGFFPLIPDNDAGFNPEDLGVCEVCGQPLWIRQNQFGSYIACAKSPSHQRRKITVKDATTIARFMKITCNKCKSQVKGCKSTKDNNVFLVCTNQKCNWSRSLKSIV